ncbi:hypothetical protein TNCT1_38340 [Streptomyces sp. 1-11]|nr:hypothetical protein TNCT1_38340 [Streptomyces sp. 1-11]
MDQQVTDTLVADLVLVDEFGDRTLTLDHGGPQRARGRGREVPHLGRTGHAWVAAKQPSPPASPAVTPYFPNGSEVISFGEPVVADEGAGEAREGEEVLGFALVATVEATASGEPCHGAFDGPPAPAEPL